ncbi:hypothetical protein G7Y89_g15074 [Cudoniella acicularis]|uniref:Uncharacterized protein n=1 Tax=Cudoniella acicularis TaxID=354080 RepID=A0A8H4QTD1_9HELO|nr:hypothetical protein G7Y89_g15074 [Cudoniella acicularis]
MASSRGREVGDDMEYETPRSSEQSTSWGGILGGASRFISGRQAHENTAVSHSGISSERHRTSSHTSHQNPGRHRGNSNRGPALETTADRLRRERNEVEAERDELEDKLKELKRELECQTAIVVNIKASTERVLASTQDKELFIGRQAVDRDIQAEFVTLFKAPRTWSRFLGAAKNVKVDSITPKVREEFNFLVPGLDDSKLESILNHSSRKKYLAQGWIGFKMTNYLFSTLPDGKFPGTAIRDLWVESSQAESIQKLEQALCNAAHPDRKCITVRDFHDWRAYTASLLSKATSDVIPSTDEYLLDLVSEMMTVLSNWSKGPEVHDKMAAELEDILRSAIEFSKLLRVQRASWSVRYPEFRLEAIQTEYRSLQHVAMFDPTTMKSLAPHEQDERTDNKYIELIIIPALFKRGNADGDHFETCSTIQPCSVLWGELDLPKEEPQYTGPTPMEIDGPDNDDGAGSRGNRHKNDITGPGNTSLTAPDSDTENKVTVPPLTLGQQENWPRVPQHEPGSNSSRIVNQDDDFEYIERSGSAMSQRTADSYTSGNGQRQLDRQRSRSPKKPFSANYPSLPPRNVNIVDVGYRPGEQGWSLGERPQQGETSPGMRE